MAVGATAIWRARPSGSNTNGGGYDPGISGAATDYSQQNSAQASGTHGTATGTTTFTDTVAANFTSAMVGNCIQIVSGAGFTAGFYFVTAFTSSTAVVLDRSPGTGTVAVWNLGGGWADYWTNTTSGGPLVGGNITFVLGSGTPNPASYTYDYTFTSPATFGAAAAQPNYIVANDPSTPGYLAPPNTGGGMPVTKMGAAFNFNGVTILGMWFVNSNTSGGLAVNAVQLTPVGCVFDQFGNDCGVVNASEMIGCEVFDSTGGTGGSQYAAATSNLLLGCNIHDCKSNGVLTGAGGATIMNSIIAKNKGGSTGILINQSACHVVGCTIDGNAADGISFSGTTYYTSSFTNNIVSNHTGAGAVGINGGTTQASIAFGDYNAFYNNTSDTTFGYGPHDTHGGSNPYVGQSTENYTLA